MSNPDSFEYQVIRQLGMQQRRHDKQVGDIPAIYLPWTQRILNPFPLASSGNVFSENPLPWVVRLLAFYCSVFVDTTNNATNFWTLDLVSNNSGVVLASLNTSAIAANGWIRLSDLTINNQPVSTDVAMFVRPTATLSPGSIYILPSVPLLRT